MTEKIPFQEKRMSSGPLAITKMEGIAAPKEIIIIFEKEAAEAIKR